MDRDVKDFLQEANALQEEGRLLEAALTYKTIIEKDPGNVEALFNWGCIALRRGNLKNAETLFEKLLQVAPDHIEGYFKLGQVHIYAGNPWAAEKVCRAGLRVNERKARLHGLLGQSLHEQGRAAEAIESLETALELGMDDDFNIVCYLGIAHVSAGNKDKAEKNFKMAMELKPENAENHFLYAHVHKYTEGDSHIKIMEALLNTLKDDDKNAARIHFSLAKAMEDLKSYDRAFPHYAEANRRVRAGISYDTRDTEEEFESIKRAFSGDFLKKEVSVRETDPVPIFIIGLPRSGSTLTEQTLCKHPLVSTASELEYLRHLQKAHNLLDLKQWKEDISSIPVDLLQTVRDQYIAYIKRHAPDSLFIIDKMPSNFRYIGLIQILFPNARVLHCTRDAMDMCFSIYKHNFHGDFPYAYDLQELAAYYNCYKDLMTFWQARLPGFIHDVPYEDMVTDQARVVRSILSFCGLEWDPACLDFYKQGASVMTASALQVRELLYKTSIGSWEAYKENLQILEQNIFCKGIV